MRGPARPGSVFSPFLHHGPMKALLLVTLLLAVPLLVAEPAAATCSFEYYTIDPVKKDTGTPVDAVKVTFGIARCEPPPQ